MKLQLKKKLIVEKNIIALNNLFYIFKNPKNIQKKLQCPFFNLNFYHLERRSPIKLNINMNFDVSFSHLLF